MTNQIKKFRVNKAGALVGKTGGVRRLAAHTYEVKAASHPDDHTIGLGGTIFRLATEIAEQHKRRFTTGSKRFGPDFWMDCAEVWYRVYIESLSPQVARCQCPFFIQNGTLCKHGERAIKVERRLKRAFPAEYAEEKRRQRELMARGQRPWPYCGSVGDER